MYKQFFIHTLYILLSLLFVTGVTGVLYAIPNQSQSLKKSSIYTKIHPLKELQSPEWIRHALSVAISQSEQMYKVVDSTSRLPRSIQNGMVSAADWTAGFFPGILWYLYAYSGDSQWKERAEHATALLQQEQFNAWDHDIGFKMYCSYGTGWRLTRNSDYEKVIFRSAKTLSSRYSYKTGLILSWDANEERDWQFPVIIDNMMNLELLMEAWKLSGDTTLRHIALSHADRTMKYHYRSNLSCPHVVDYEAETGRVRKFDWNNGSDDICNSTWSRGQSWGLYGFTMMYRETNDEKYLHHAERIADFLLTHPGMPKDLIPYWDYTGANRSTMRDASAAAIMASALLELSCYSAKGKKYFEAGEKQLQSLASPTYLAKPGTHQHFIIKHATGNYLRHSELDGSLSYADYYFVEALTRYIRLTNRQPLLPQRQQGINSELWLAEDHSGSARLATRGDTLEISTPKGFTLWYKERLTGEYEITYNACMPMQGDPCQRLSDLNCFWGANDPQHPDNLFARTSYRNGIFQRYKTLTLFYVGYGGNYNSTTRFRQYFSGLPGQEDNEVRPVISEYTDPEHLLKPAHWYRIRIVVKKKVTRFYVDGELLFTRELKPQEADGNFGFRLLQNHVLISNFKVMKHEH